MTPYLFLEIFSKLFEQNGLCCCGKMVALFINSTTWRTGNTKSLKFTELVFLVTLGTSSFPARNKICIGRLQRSLCPAGNELVPRLTKIRPQERDRVLKLTVTMSTINRLRPFRFTIIQSVSLI